MASQMVEEREHFRFQLPGIKEKNVESALQAIERLRATDSFWYDHEEFVHLAVRKKIQQ